MSNQLFPTFEMPAAAETSKKQINFYRSIDFDFDLGDFKRDGADKLVEADGQTAYLQWCLKIIQTERFKKMAYSSDIGVETNAAMKMAGRAATEAAMEKTITEALMVNPKTEYVRGFEFSWQGDELYATIEVKAKNVTAANLSIQIS